jgi:hypothetical protein
MVIRKKKTCAFERRETEGFQREREAVTDEAWFFPDVTFIPPPAHCGKILA